MFATLDFFWRGFDLMDDLKLKGEARGGIYRPLAGLDP